MPLANRLLPDFLITPRQLLQDPQIHPLDCQVYGVIYWYTNMRLQKCTASNDQIAHILSASKSGVNKAIIRLVKNGYIQSVYERKHHRRTLIPLITFRQASSVPPGTLAVSQMSPHEDAVSQTGQRTVPNGIRKQLQTGSPNKKRKQEKEDILHISSGALSPNRQETATPGTQKQEQLEHTHGPLGDPPKPKRTTREKQKAYGDTEVNDILAAFENHIGQIPSDKYKRRVAHNFRQNISAFIKKQNDLFQTLRGRPLDFAYVHATCWQWYLKKEYALQTENLETVRRKVRVYLDLKAKQLKQEAALKIIDECSKSGNSPAPSSEPTNQQQEREANRQRVLQSPAYQRFLAQKHAAQTRNWVQVKELAAQIKHVPRSSP